MRYSGRRPMGRLCCWALVALMALGLPMSTFAAPPQSGATTTVSDTVLMADGAAAQGSLIISWPAFVTAGGVAVAAGATSVALGAGGALSVALIPNASATPAGVYYTVVYQLGPGEVKTEYWVVPTTSPANLATVRATPGSGVAAQPVSMQYVNSALAAKANDSSVVHLNGSETISGAKSFAVAPSVPVATSSGQVANKSYVDQAVANVGAGNYLPTSGGSMSGPITLPSDPAAPMQASTKEYVDSSFAVKADLIAGVVPSSELGSGPSTAGSCLLGNGTSASWGACGGGSGAGNLSTNPVATQNISQPAGTQFSANNLANIRYVTGTWNWSQSPADSLATAGSNTIHLTPCPLGMDTGSSASYYSYKVYIAGTGTAEAVPVTGGSCAPGATSGTITVTTAYTHSAGYTVGSASSGIQEAWNDAWLNDIGVGVAGAAAPVVKLAADMQYDIYATLYLRGRGGILDGAGSMFVCHTRDRCIYIGTNQGHPFVHYHKVYNLSGASAINVDGVQVANVSATNGTYTITTASAHPFVVGDTVDCEYHSQTIDQHWSSSVVTVPNTTTFTVTFGSGTAAAGANTFGFCNILNAFVEDNSDHVTMQDVNIFQVSPGGNGFFSYGIVNDNDQQFIVERAGNRSSQMLKNTPNWPIGAFVYQRTDQGMAGITYLKSSEFTNINCFTGGGNGFVFSDSVCQAFPTYGVRYFGGLQPATISNVYQEAGGMVNQLYGYAGQAGYVLTGTTNMLGNFPSSGYYPVFPSGSGGTAATVRNYYVIPRSSTQGAGPVLYIGQSNPSNSGGVNITTTWPSPSLGLTGTLTFDLLVTTGGASLPPTGTGNFAVATGISFSSACATNGMCTFVDTQTAPSSYSVPAQQYGPTFWFWPTTFAINNGPLFLSTAASVPSAVSNLGMLAVSIIAERCMSYGQSAQRSPIWVQCLATDGSGGSGTIATVLQQLDHAGGGPPANSKGRINLGSAITTVTDLMTLQDSNFVKTLATPGERPTNDPGDMALGNDQMGGLAERAATSISSYINAVPSGTNYLERLTAAAKTFNVPVTVNGNLSVIGGSVTLPVTGTGSQCLHVSATGVVSGTGADCGSGGGGGSGVVNSGATSQVAMYSGSGTTVSGDSSLTDNGTTLNYIGSGGISASGGVFSGNLTVGGQLILTGPWQVSSPMAAGAMSAATAGMSSLGISNDGNFYISANAGSPSRVLTTATDAVPTVFGRSGAVTAAGGDYSCAQVTGCTPNTTTVAGHALTSNVAISASDLGSGALANGITATTQAPGDNSTKVATTAFVMQQAGSSSTVWVPFPGYNSINQAAFPTSANTAAVFGFIVPMTLTTSKVVYRVGSTADNTANTYEIGIYNGSGTLVAHFQAAGTTFSPATGATKTQNWAEGTVTLPPGKYYEAIVSSCTSACATFTTANGTATTFYSNSAFTQNVSSATLGSTITAPGAGLESFGASPLSIILE